MSHLPLECWNFQLLILLFKQGRRPKVRLMGSFIFYFFLMVFANVFIFSVLYMFIFRFYFYIPFFIYWFPLFFWIIIFYLQYLHHYQYLGGEGANHADQPHNPHHAEDPWIFLMFWISCYGILISCSYLFPWIVTPVGMLQME